MTTPVRVGTRRPTLAVAGLFFLNGIAIASFIPRLPEMRDVLSIDLESLGLAVTFAGLGGLIGSAVCSPVLHRLGTRRTIVGSGILLGLSVAAIPRASGLWLFVGVVGVFAFADVLVDVAMNLHGSRLSEGRRRPIMNRLHGLWSVGTLVGGVIAARLAAAGTSLELHLGVVGLVLVMAIPLLAIPLRSLEPRVATVAEARTGGRWAILSFGVVGMAAVISEVVGWEWAPFRMTDDFGASASLGSLAYAMFALGMVLGRLGGDELQRRVGSRRMVPTAAALSGVALLVAGLAPTEGVVLAALAAAGLATSVVFPSIYDQAARAPGRVGAMLGGMTAGQRIGFVIQPALVGWVASRPGSGVGVAMVSVSIPAIVIFVVTLRYVRRLGGLSD